jgi:iron complex outermembrane receptor protein
LNYADRGVARLTDVNGWGGGVNTPQAGYVAYPHIEDKVNSLRLSARRDLEIGPISGVQLGMNLTKRDKARTGDEGRLVVNGAGGYAVATAPGSETAVAGSLGIPIISFDPRGLVGSTYNLAKWVDASVLAKDWSVTEKVNTVYAMGELDGNILNLPYKGNFGAPFVHTDQQTTGNKVDLATCTGITVETCPSSTISAGTKYSDVLPSMNLSFDLGSDQVLRFGAAKVISRANLDDMRASSAFGVNTSGANPILSGSGGNPDLKPFSAKTLDLSYEKYFGNKGYVSVAAFYKKLDTYVLRTPRVFDFKDQVSSATPLPASGPFAGSTVGLLTTPTNGEGGSIHGFELAVNIPFSMITPVLDGFGITVNHSDTSSAVSLPAVSFGTQNIAAASIPLPGLSKKVSNLRVYYEKAGFQVAWAARKRSDFLGQVSDFQDNAQLTFIKGETIVDIQASYEFQSGWFKGLTLLAQANNWTKTPYIEYNTDRNVSVFKIEPGRSYQVGVNYKF